MSHEKRQVYFKGKWDCEMTREELLEVIGSLMAERRWKNTWFSKITDSPAKGVEHGD